MSLTAKYKDLQTSIESVWFKTRSPYPTEPVTTIIGRGLPYYENYPYLRWESKINQEAITLYLAEQFKILKLNNPEADSFMLSMVIRQRIINWRGNNLVQRALINNPGLLDTAIWWVEEGERLVEPICEFRKTWYSDEIERLVGVERSKAKAAARSLRDSTEKREEIAESSFDYRIHNYDVLPTIGYLDREIGTMTKNTIIKHGKGLYVGTKLNNFERIKRARIEFPNKGKSDIAELLMISERTVRKYW